ncbi:MAG: GyrI-like domain-containing protein [Terrimonas ferruginea]|uniref:GyrI-like domain-containing protein n=1 Tax=Terrimonas ferruginea TaxID=249 RepID=UPI000929D28D|nr:GyrI-like domain-containing protein [Terrimonas ferruginea]MBN8783111.1 GyrI-like domain-containing protein [Terrimonas ferruginea]OJW44285.1 MAG: hypothetical protein BGO56_20610 [Sphingobacteriales bacterium 48-107]
MEKTDLLKTDPDYYRATRHPSMLRLGPLPYLSVSGQGDPSGKAFAERVQLLYSLIYAVKFRYKEENRDFVVAKLEGLWWYDEERWGTPPVSEAPKVIPRDVWEYKLLIRLPVFVTAESVAATWKAIAGKRQIAGVEPPAFELLEEGDVVQILHTGPFDKEPETLARLQEYMSDKKMGRNGFHHEIYLSDFRRTAPEKLRTILREPVKVFGTGIA